MNRTAPAPRSLNATAAALGLVTLLGPASIDMYLPTLPVIAEELRTDYTTTQFTLTVFLLALGGGQLLFGPLIDAAGRRRPLLFGLACFVAASIWAALSQSAESLIAARTVQGLSASLAMVTATSSVRDVAEGVRATQIFALLMTVQGLGPVVAPAVGGLIGDILGWRWIFFVLGCLGLLVIATSAVMLPESLPKQQRTPFRLRPVLLTYCEIVKDRRFLLPALSLAAAFIFLFAYIGGSAYAYQAFYGMSPGLFGLVFGVTGLAVLAGAIASAKLADRTAVSRIAVTGVVLIFAGSGLALISSLLPLGLPGILLGMLIALGGLGAAETTLMSIALATRTTALGASAAVLGAGPMMLAATVTPISAVLVEKSVTSWLGLLFAMAACTLALTLIVARLGVPGGAQVRSTH